MPTGGLTVATVERDFSSRLLGGDQVMRKRIFTTTVAILALGSMTLPSVADARGVHVRKMRLQDRCDPASFNAAFGDGVCVPHKQGGLVTVDEFLAELNPVDFGHDKWNNHPDELKLREGDQISVTVRGGELHTFSEVDHFGAGCFQPINEALELTDVPTPEQCAEFFANSSVAPNGASTLIVEGLPAGTHLFMCEIHPWMRTVVEVEKH
jgi:plastocyanin